MYIKEDLLYGEPCRGSSSTCLQTEYDELRLHLGSSSYWGGEHHVVLKLVSFEMLGFHIKVTDQEVCKTVYSMVKANDSVENVKAVLQPIFFKALMKDPAAIGRQLEATFNAGVEEGRRRKVEEFKKVFLL